MQEIIDVAGNVGPYAAQLAAAGVKTVIRYYNHRNSTRLPSKCLTGTELEMLYAAGLSVAVVFEARAGAGGNIGDFGSGNGTRDATRALSLAASLGQPEQSAIYFAVDSDFVRAADLAQITAYFDAAKRTVGGKYRMGVYGSGAVGDRLSAAGLVELVWLSGSTGWTGTLQALQAGRWAVFQKYLDRAFPYAHMNYDGNIINPAFDNFGQFSGVGPAETPLGHGSAAVFRVTARSGLNLRSGPGETYRVIETLPLGTLVTGVGTQDVWIKVDIEGDGSADGYMHSTFLQAVSGGLPIPLPRERTPLDVALAELQLGVAEIPGRQDNPRIVMYHASTTGSPAGDETAWCSSFVNYCVEQAGLVGTNSKWARSWHDQHWGQDVTASPRQGDIVVFRRYSRTVEAGHVAFFMEADANTILCLGGNQGDRVRMQRYPKNGQAGQFKYQLLSIRRG
ncbi:TIGR02594 family protein [Rhizobium sp. RAF56]|uniref:TIGR02594 family protein n=1 Tax=Rhizobium sp. RAF56 TaxID=3233062 RepID=UPI003F9AD092